MVLHETRVVYVAVGRERGGDADAARGLLEDLGQDEAVIDAGLLGDVLDAAADVADLVLRVVRDAVLLAGDQEVVVPVVEPVSTQSANARGFDDKDSTDISSKEIQVE